MRSAAAFEWCRGQSYPYSRTASRQGTPSWWTRQARGWEQEQLSDMLSYSNFQWRIPISIRYSRQEWPEETVQVQMNLWIPKLFLKKYSQLSEMCYFCFSLCLQKYKSCLATLSELIFTSFFSENAYFILSWKQMHLYCLFLIHILIKAVHFFADPIKRMKLNKPQRYLLSNLHAQCAYRHSGCPRVWQT